MNLTLRIWRQKDPTVKGKMVTYKVSDVSPDMSFLEMLDVLNERLILDGDDPVVDGLAALLVRAGVEVHRAPADAVADDQDQWLDRAGASTASIQPARA